MFKDLLLAWKKSLLPHNDLFPIISVEPAVSLVLPYQCKSKAISVPCDQHSVGTAEFYLVLP